MERLACRVGRGLEKAAVARAGGGLCSSLPVGEWCGREHHVPGELGSLPLKTWINLGLLNLAGQRWMGLQQQGQRGTAWGRGRDTVPDFPSPLCPPRQHCRDPIPLSKD